MPSPSPPFALSLSKGFVLARRHGGLRLAQPESARTGRLAPSCGGARQPERAAAVMNRYNR